MANYRIEGIKSMGPVMVKISDRWCKHHK